METYHAILSRYSEGLKQTLGKLDIYDGNNHVFSCFTLELAWKDNQKNISCIPKGKYRLKPYSSPTKGSVYLFDSVPNRSYIEIHSGNFFFDIEGCILVGDTVIDINCDGLLDVANSVETLEKLKDILNYQPFDLAIV